MNDGEIRLYTLDEPQSRLGPLVPPMATLIFHSVPMTAVVAKTAAYRTAKSQTLPPHTTLHVSSHGKHFYKVYEQSSA